MKGRQQGVALITAVLIVALVTTIAVAMASHQQLDIRRSANLFDGDQAWLAVLGGEDYARNVLVEDRKNGDTDALDENWAQPVQFPFENMALSGQVEDMQGRFNLNNLLAADGKVNDFEVRRLERLLKLLDLDAAIAQAVIDWLDKDIDPQPNGGAEDDFYMQLQPGYRAANRLMVSASELRLVNGVTAEAYEKLAPYIVALPKPTPININTASAAVLAIVADNMTLADGESLLAARDKTGFGSIAAFAQKDAKVAGISDVGLSLNSDYFLLNAIAEFDNSRSQQFSLLWRKGDGTVKVIMRGQGAY